MTIEFAPAKINLALHVTGQREDGYHLLDTLVAFVDTGDMVVAEPSDRDSFSVEGRFSAGLLADPDGFGGNLVLRARDALRDYAHRLGKAAGPVRLSLEKNLPLSSGVGGGSADAAATLRALDRCWSLGLARETLREIGLGLGADVPMCVESRALVARGIGEEIRFIDDLPSFHLLIVNPLRAVSTPHIFRALTSKQNPPLRLPEPGAGPKAWLVALREARNDLQAPAEAIEPAIGEVMAYLNGAEASLVRMSGSGATCFALFETADLRDALAAKLERERPQWYWRRTKIMEGLRHGQD